MSGGRWKIWKYLLSSRSAPLRLAEEEIPCDGAVVTRSFQYARWFGGRSFLWLGRAKHAGRGEESSGLTYDTAERVARPTAGT
jgi:hypothetical protein